MKRALVLLSAAVSCMVAGGVWFAAVEHVSVASGLYWAVITATTVGYGDIIPHGTTGHLVTVAVALTALPLTAVAFGELLSERVHIRGAIQAARHHLELMEQARKHHGELKALAEKHHREQLDRADVHAEAVKTHVDAAVSAVAPRKRGM